MREISLLQLELPRLELRLDVFDEMQIGLLRLGVVRMAGHRDVALGTFLIERGRQFTPLEQRVFQIVDGFGGREFLLDLAEQRRDLAPISQINLLGHQLARRVHGQLSKRQQIHRAYNAAKNRKNKRFECRALPAEVS